MRTVTVPDWGADDSLYQQVEVPDPGDPGYTGTRLPDPDPWAKYVNPVIDGHVNEHPGPDSGWQPETEAEPEAGQ